MRDNSDSFLIKQKGTDLSRDNKKPILHDWDTAQASILEQGSFKGKFNSFEFIWTDLDKNKINNVKVEKFKRHSKVLHAEKPVIKSKVVHIDKKTIRKRILNRKLIRSNVIAPKSMAVCPKSKFRINNVSKEIVIQKQQSLEYRRFYF